MGKNKSKYLGLLAVTALIAVTVMYLFKDNSLSEVFSVILMADTKYIALIFTMMAGYIMMEGLIEFLLMRSLGCDVKLSMSLQIAFVGYYFSMITPSSTGGQPMQVYYLSKKGQDGAKSSLAIVCFTLLYQVVLLAYCYFMMISQHAFLAGSIRAASVTLIYGFTVGLLFIALLVSSMASKKTVVKIMLRGISLMSSLRLIKDKEAASANAVRQVDSYIGGVRFLIAHPAVLVRTALLIVVQLTLLFAIPFFALKTLNIDAFTMFQILGVQSILHVSVCSIPLPGSVGASERVFYMLYALFIPAEMVIPAVVLSRGAGFLVFLVISGIITLITHVTTRRKAAVTLDPLPPQSDV